MSLDVTIAVVCVSISCVMKRRPSGIQHKGSASSSKLRMLGSERKAAHIPGRAPVRAVTLTRKGVEEYRRDAELALRTRLQNMDAEHREGLERLQSLAEDDDFCAGDMPEAPNMVNMEDILDGSARIELSHAGGEFVSLEQGIEEDIWEDEDDGGTKPRAYDWRTRRDRTEVRNRAFLSQMPEMVAAYIRMCAGEEIAARPRSEGEGSRPRTPTVEEVYEIQVLDMFETSDVQVKLQPHANGVGAALILEGLMPCAPWNPTLAVKIRVLEVYRVIHIFGNVLTVSQLTNSPLRTTFISTFAAGLTSGCPGPLVAIPPGV
ncbi:hypothetical protein B0H12DRAFT_1075290 [Mycena haematopus]|nr:hypothetical protein B0H12DRAFT_1075290 [Mycena haematopus]